MRMGYGIYQEQTQKLMMTPELRIAIKILQYSAIELAEYIQQEAAENPVLEIREEAGEENSDETIETEVTREELEEKYDIDWEDYFADRSDLGFQGTRREEAEELKYEQFISKAPTMHEHLIFQLSLLELTKVERKVGEYLIGNLDDYGYLQVSVEEAAQKFSLTIEEIEAILKMIQSFEPYGVGARNLVESLVIQAENLKIMTPLVKRIIEFYLPELAKGKIAKIAQELNVETGEVQQALDIIKKLDPKPGRNFSSANDVRYIVPDIVLERIDGEYVVLVNDTAFPRLGINNSYRELLKKEENSEAKAFVEQKLNSAAWLIKSIEQRRLTLYKVAQCLVEFQRDFLDHGVRYLKPLNMKQVATRVGVHESTVSRATAGKYAQTPQGVYELKYFFTSGVENLAGGFTSAESVKKSIVDLINVEDSKSPFSDQKICDLLNLKGINISRRTVAKYRDELGISPASVRKRYE